MRSELQALRELWQRRADECVVKRNAADRYAWEDQTMYQITAATLRECIKDVDAVLAHEEHKA